MLKLESKKKQYDIDGALVEMRVPSVQESESFQVILKDNLNNEAIKLFFGALGMPEEVFRKLQLWMIEDIINDLFGLKKN